MKSKQRKDPLVASSSKIDVDMVIRRRFFPFLCFVRSCGPRGAWVSSARNKGRVTEPSQVLGAAEMMRSNVYYHMRTCY